MKQAARLGRILAVAVSVTSVLDVALAGPVTTPNAFTSGTPAVAAEVNANFSAFEAAVNDNDARLAALISRVDDLMAENQQLASDLAAATDFIENLREVMSLQDDNQGNPAVVFSGVNVQINNGQGATNSINGLGNLVIGYDEPRQDDSVGFCANGLYQTEADCLANNELFSHIHKSGSHNLIVGPENNYSREGGLVVGYRNTINATGSSVTGGSSNTASGRRSSVSGGLSNRAAGVRSSVSGGVSNLASGQISSIIGGASNEASGQNSSVTGGAANQSSGQNSSVSGGLQREAAGDLDWVAGSLTEDQ